MRDDAVSHHILRLAFAGSEEKRRWLLTTETALFKLRLESETATQVATFMSHNQLTFVPVREAAKLPLLCSRHWVLLRWGAAGDGPEI